MARPLRGDGLRGRYQIPPGRVESPPVDKIEFSYGRSAFSSAEIERMKKIIEHERGRHVAIFEQELKIVPPQPAPTEEERRLDQISQIAESDWMAVEVMTTSPDRMGDQISFEAMRKAVEEFRQKMSADAKHGDEPGRAVIQNSLGLRPKV